MKRIILKKDINVEIMKKYGFFPRYNESTGEICEFIKLTPNKQTHARFKKETKTKFFKRIDEFVLQDEQPFIDIYGLYDLIKARIGVES